MKLIDIGAFNGDSALHFISYPDIDSIDAYEPNNSYESIWRAIEDVYPITFTNKAVYTHNGEIRFYQRPATVPLGSTIMKSKLQGVKVETKIVDCVDILDIVPAEKYCLKIDAEGAEYDILERIIEHGKPENIDRLYVEWHDTKMDTDNSSRQVALEQYFADRIKNWL